MELIMDYSKVNSNFLGYLSRSSESESEEEENKSNTSTNAINNQKVLDTVHSFLTSNDEEKDASPRSSTRERSATLSLTPRSSRNDPEIAQLAADLRNRLRMSSISQHNNTPESSKRVSRESATYEDLVPITHQQIAALGKKKASRGEKRSAVRGSVRPFEVKRDKVVRKALKEFRKHRLEKAYTDFSNVYAAEIDSEKYKKDRHQFMKEAKGVKSYAFMMALMNYCQQHNTKFKEFYDKYKGETASSIAELTQDMCAFIARNSISAQYIKTSSSDEKALQDLVAKIVRLGGNKESVMKLLVYSVVRSMLVCDPCVMQKILKEFFQQEIKEQPIGALFRATTCSVMLHAMLTDALIVKTLKSFPFAALGYDACLSSGTGEPFAQFLTQLASAMQFMKDNKQWESLHEAFYETLRKNPERVPANHTPESFVIQSFFLRNVNPEVMNFQFYIKEGSVEVAEKLLQMSRTCMSCISNLTDATDDQLQLLAQIGHALLPSKSVNEILRGFVSLKQKQVDY